MSRTHRALVLNHNLKSVPLVLTGDKALASFGKVAVGGSFGESNRDLAATETAAGNTLVHKNASCIGQVRCSLTDQVMLPSEYAHAMSKAHGGRKAESSSIALGAILFF
jgi:hypothetical protein